MSAPSSSIRTLGESSSVTAASFKENSNNADAVALTDNKTSTVTSNKTIKSKLPFSNNPPLPSSSSSSIPSLVTTANNESKQSRRVLLPSLGGGSNSNNNASKTQPLLLVVGAVSSTAPSLTASSGGAPASSSSSSLMASHRHEPQQQYQQQEQQLQQQSITTRRESLDETAITNHTHSSASHFSSSTSGSSSTFTTSTTTTAGSNSSSNNIHDTIGRKTRIFRPLSSSSSSSRIGGSNIVAMTTNTTFKNGIFDEVVAATSPKHKNSNGDRNNGENTANSLSSSIVSYTKTLSSSERILRYGETIESLFCLLEKTNDCEEEEKAYEKHIPQSYHWNLCHEICLGSRGNDAFAWVEALELSLNEAVISDVTRDHAGGGDEEEKGKERISNVGKRLIQLHRRATSHFKLSTEKDTLHHKPVLQLWLLYSLVLLKYGDNNKDDRKSNNDAKQTLRHVQRLYFSTCEKEFYKALVMAVQQKQEQVGTVDEHNDNMEKRGNGCDEDTGVNAVIASWQQCLDQGGSIVKIVKAQMTRLENERLLETNDENGNHAAHPSSSAEAATAVGIDGTVVNESQTANTAALKAAAPARLMSLPLLNPKKSEQRWFAIHEAGLEKHNAHDVPENPILVSSERLLYVNNGNCSLSVNNDEGVDPGGRTEPSSSFRAKIASRKKLKTTDRLTPYRTRKSTRDVRGVRGGGLRAILSQTTEEGNESDDSSDDADNSFITAKRSAESCASSSTVMAKRSADSCRSTASSSKDIPLFQDISPIDQEPTTSVRDMDLDYLLNWDPTKRDASSKKRVTIAEDAIKEKVAKRAAVSVPKITRNDLGYMMDWNPFGKLEKQTEDVGNSSSSGNGSPGVVVQRSTSQGNNVGSNMSTIDEATEVSVTLDQGDNNSASGHEGAEKISAKPGNIHVPMGTSADTSNDNPSRNDDEKSSASLENMISTSGFERSFLPLIQNKNIIHVENEPYAKLGVIGKGGSCKVYRALSRDCDVIALKKVKLDGLNKAAIDGYANEIALLKRLKGNPAIIQLFSSEVDIERKSILLVMELGEVDLNYVLRQQELLASNQLGRGAGRSSLNMNFIRLTWQQMLTAVHSIHEERIIHSDLKPANFLFVRGALKLIDFGIAKAIEREDTTNIYRETLSGTLSYMSPEAIMDTSTNAKGVRVNKCGRPSDIWSLGCILYQMVYGKTPFADCHGIPQKVLAITNVNHEINFPDGVDESAISAMKLCLQRNPKQRPPIIGANGLLNDHCFLHGRKKV